MTLRRAIILILALSACTKDDNDLIEKERARLADVICGVKEISDVENALKAEGFTYSLGQERLSGIKHIPTEGSELVSASVQVNVITASGNIKGECSVAVLFTGP